MANVMTRPYPIFQTETHMDAPTASKTRRLRSLGFLGRVMDGTLLVATSLFLAMATLTSAAKADTLLASSDSNNLFIGTLLVVVFAIMLAMLRQTWRHTTKGINSAPRTTHRII